MSETLHLEVHPHQATERAKVDFNFFAGLCLPSHIMRFPFPDYYVALWVMLVQAIDAKDPKQIEKIVQFVIGLPRGFIKTTFLKVLVCWLVVHDKFEFFLIICATEPLSESFLTDIQAMLQCENIESLYGTWDPAVDNSDTKKGVYHRHFLVIKARGAGSAVRGINEGNRRPQFILCDDMQTKENDESETDRERLMTWFVGTLLKTVDQTFAVAVYVGNMYSDHCILYKLKHDPYWISLITGAILEDGTSLWPELFSIEALYQSFKRDESLGKADIWFAEIMNDPIEAATSLLTQGPLPVEIITYIPAPDASFITVDPAGFRKNSDDNVITAHYLVDKDNLIAEMDGGIWTPQQTVENTIVMAVRHESSLIAVEEVGYQQALLFWIDHFLKEEKIEGIEVVPLKRGTGKSKEQHIRLFIAELYAKSTKFLRPQDRAKFTFQATAYRTGKSNNKDDWMDSPSMGITVRNLYSHLLSVRRTAQTKSHGVVVNNTPF